MPRKCCVPGCTSNYDSTLKRGEPSVTTFSFPKDDARKQLWLRAVSRKNWTPTSNSSVCIKHFHEKDVILFDSHKTKDGIKQLLLKFPKVKEHAVPALFENSPLCLTNKETIQRKDPEVRRVNRMKKNADDVDRFLKADLINCYDSLKDNFVKMCKNSARWNYKIKHGDLWFYVLNIDYEEEYEQNKTLSVMSSVVVKKDLTVTIVVNGNQVSSKDLEWILPCDLKLSRWSQLENILSRYYTVDRPLMKSEQF